jgi:hypothetical protein
VITALPDALIGGAGKYGDNDAPQCVRRNVEKVSVLLERLLDLSPKYFVFKIG